MEVELLGRGRRGAAAAHGRGLGCADHGLVGRGSDRFGADLLVGAGGDQEERCRIAQVGDAPIEVGEDVGEGQGEDTVEQFVIELADDVRRHEEDAVACAKVEACQLWWCLARSVHQGRVFIVRLVAGDAAAGEVERGRRPARRDHYAISLATDAAEADADLVLGDARAVPLLEGALGLAVDLGECPREAQVERLPTARDLGDDVSSEIVARRGRALGHEKELQTIRIRAETLCDPSPGRAFERLVIDDRELPNLQGFVQDDGFLFGERGERARGASPLRLRALAAQPKGETIGQAPSANNPGIALRARCGRHSWATPHASLKGSHEPPSRRCALSQPDPMITG